MALCYLKHEIQPSEKHNDGATCTIFIILIFHFSLVTCSYLLNERKMHSNMLPNKTKNDGTIKTVRKLIVPHIMFL